ncbi:hypothetical protein RclHR1_12560001 [Rhizophagus clarus]|uniref:C2H2-type domain-containing protein n=1 Tax=Rhizophagus clarus TaxID=94130 RepID=A0A2Z6QMV8_9GLOM|nr:hypothetical protein RclHR1_12560001 [Rhizophagus clarus]
MTSHFNLPTFDSVYNISVLQNQLSQQQKFQQQQQQQQRYHQVIEANTFANTSPYLTTTNSQHHHQQEAAVTAAAQLAYVQHQIQSSYIYNPNSYPSPPLDSNAVHSLNMDSTTDSSNHHHNENKNYHGIITDNPHLTSPPPFTNDHKPHINTTDNYPTTSSYTSSAYPPSTMDRRTSLNAGLVSGIHHGKVMHQLSPSVDGGSSDTTEPWRAPVVMAPQDNNGIPFSFGHSTAAPMGYFSQHPVSYDRNGIPHFAAPTPQDYPITMGSMGLTNPNGNGSRNAPPQFQQNPQRPRPVTPQDMMTTFSSKTVSSTPKRYKCNVCQKRFTRPSSLQTHTYSHTGEKPFKCPVEGCGRHFSVVSNLRRHQKIHTK